MSRSASLCERVTEWQGGPEMRRRLDSTAYLAGIYHCAHAWSCPDCGPRIADAREAELEALVSRARDRGLHAVVASMTIAQGTGDDARVMFRDVMETLMAFTRGGRWNELRQQWGIAGYVMGVEVLHGPQGWHPYVHALLLTRVPAEACAANRATLATHWRRAVRKGFRAMFASGVEDTVTIAPCDVPTFIDRIAFFDPSESQCQLTRPGYRRPWEIASASLEGSDPKDAELWRGWQIATCGRKQLIWSDGTRRILGRTEMTDEECLAESESPSDQLVARFSAAEWYVLYKHNDALLEAAERGGRDAVLELARSIAREACERGDALALRLARDERSVFYGVCKEVTYE